ncbi:hypothetical protein Tco_0762081, partial [Tanacetum coccineum]
MRSEFYTSLAFFVIAATSCRRCRVLLEKPSDVVELIVLSEKTIAATLYASGHGLHKLYMVQAQQSNRKTQWTKTKPRPTGYGPETARRTESSHRTLPQDKQ